MSTMFYECESFNQDISGWDVSKVIDKYKTFDDCPIEEKYKSLNEIISTIHTRKTYN